MAVTIQEAEKDSDYRAFVQLPFDLYKGNRFWVPPFRNDEFRLLQPAFNPYFNSCDARFWLARKNGKLAGRIGGIIHNGYNEKTGEKLARFTRFECTDDAEVSGALLATAETWAKDKGMKGILGPLGFSNLDMQGLLIGGFDYLPSIASSYHLPYYRNLIEGAGYSKEIDWVEFRLTIGDAAVEKANRGAQLIRKRYGIETLHFTRTKDILQYADSIFGILNDSFSDLPFVSAFTPELAAFYTRKYIRLLNPAFVKIVTISGEPIGFIIGLPSLSAAMQKAKGRVFPTGFIHLLRARKGKDTMDQLLTGVKKQYHSTGAGVVLMAELQQEMLRKGMRYIETTGIFENNLSAIGNWKNYEHIQHKRRRCYRKMF